MSTVSVRVHGTGVPTSQITLPSTSSVWDLASAIQRLTGALFPANRMHLLCQSQTMVSTAPLSAYQITNDSTVLVARADAELYAWKDEDHSDKWDYDFRRIDDSGETFQRGRFPYIRPCGYFRFGFTVYGRYDGGNNAWLRKDDSAWPVAYFAVGYDTKGESLRSAGYTASKACATPPIDPPFGYFFAMDVTLVEPYATTFTAEDGVTACTVVVQARVDPSKITLLSNEIWAARSADAFRPYGLLVKGVCGSMGDVGLRKRVLLAALNSLLPYAEVLPKAEYYGRTAGGVERGAGEFCPDTCVQVLSIGGPLWVADNKKNGDVEMQELQVTQTLEWPDWINVSLAQAVLQNPCDTADIKCTCEGNTFTITGTRPKIDAFVTRLKRAMERVAPVWWTSEGLTQTALVALNTNGEAFKQVSDNFFKTMSREWVRIVGIQRVENRRLWARYQQYRDAVAAKRRRALSSDAAAKKDDDDEAAIVVERELWHATCMFAPECVYSGDEAAGFRAEHYPAGACLWPGAVGFAKDARDCCSQLHVHTTATRTQSASKKQLLLASVVTGASEDRTHMSDEASRAGAGAPDADLYDSARSVRGGSEVFLTYAHYAAYPQYLVTYEVISDTQNDAA